MTPRRTTSTLIATLAVPTLAATTLIAFDSAVEPAAAAGLRVPKHATILVHGHGYGHGRGMSQYGAEGAARKGLSANQIVKFYYPHTRSGTFRGKVRVLISEDTDQRTTVVNQRGLQIHDLGNGRTFAVPTTGTIGKATRWQMSSKRGKPAQVSYRTDAWHVWRTLSGDGEFRAPRPIRLVLPGGPSPYRGVLQSRTSTRGGSAPHRITVNKVSMENYVRAVVPSEAFPSWHQAALRAQAIAARSYAAYKMRRPLSNLYQLCDTSACQVYGGKSAETASTNRATAGTAGKIRTFHGRPALTEFSSSDGGWTVRSSLPYQVAKPDPYDGWSGNPNHTWTTRVSDAKIEKRWPKIGNLQKIRVLERDGHGQWHGRIEQIKLVGSRGSAKMSGDAFRVRLGLRSTWLGFAVRG